MLLQILNFVPLILVGVVMLIVRAASKRENFPRKQLEWFSIGYLASQFAMRFVDWVV